MPTRGYIGDAWRVSRELTLNFGLRYENFRPPYEANGLQVDTTVPLNQYFAQRNGLQSQGVPANQMSDFTLSYALNGPANGKPSWWSPEQRKFRAPLRAGLRSLRSRRADRQNVRQEFGAFRIGGALAYDQFGNDLIAQLRSVRLAGSLRSDQFPRFLQLHHVAALHRDIPGSARGRARRIPVHASGDRSHHRHFPRHFAGSEDALFDHLERRITRASCPAR